MDEFSAKCLSFHIPVTSASESLFSISPKAKDIQQMVKLEEEMDRRPATVVWATDRVTGPHMYTPTHSYTHTQSSAETLPLQDILYSAEIILSKQSVNLILTQTRGSFFPLFIPATPRVFCTFYPANQLCTTEPLLLVAVPPGAWPLLSGTGNVTLRIKQQKQTSFPPPQYVDLSGSLTSVSFLHGKSFSCW